MALPAEQPRSLIPEQLSARSVCRVPSVFSWSRPWADVEEAADIN